MNLFDYKHYQSSKGQPLTESIEASTLIFDIVGFSADMDNEAMLEIVDNIHSAMSKTLDKELKFYWAEKQRWSAKNDLILVPTGDGYGIVVNNTFEDHKVLEIAEKVYKKLTKKGLKFRMGIARGKNILAIDLNGTLNVFGYGIVLATRVCNAAKEGQILVHKGLADTLLQEKKMPELQKIETEFPAKHGLKFAGFNYYKKDEFGIKLD